MLKFFVNDDLIHFKLKPDPFILSPHNTDSKLNIDKLLTYKFISQL
jgi:hypothetical protein